MPARGLQKLWVPGPDVLDLVREQVPGLRAAEVAEAKTIAAAMEMAA